VSASDTDADRASSTVVDIVCVCAYVHAYIHTVLSNLETSI